MSFFQKTQLEQMLSFSDKKFTKKQLNIYAKHMAISFFKWNAEKIAAYVIYLQDVQKVVRSNEIEENLVKFEGATLEERYDMYLDYLNKKAEIQTEIDELK